MDSVARIPGDGPVQVPEGQKSVFLVFKKQGADIGAHPGGIVTGGKFELIARKGAVNLTAPGEERWTLRKHVTHV
jgi:hypothetical protein